ncbi:hypothetical protein [Kitasatospora sp. NPDC001132]
MPFQHDPNMFVDGTVWAAQAAADAAVDLLALRVQDPHSRTLPQARTHLISALYYLDQLDAVSATEAGREAVPPPL